MTEWFKVFVLKTIVFFLVPWVRIPPYPKILLFMSRKGNVLGNRLGICKNWKTHINVNKHATILSKTYFIKQFVINSLTKMSSLWILNNYIIKKKNVIDIYILYCSPWVKKMAIYNIFFVNRKGFNKYFKPWFLHLLSIPRPPGKKFRFVKQKKIIINKKGNKKKKYKILKKKKKEIN